MNSTPQNTDILPTSGFLSELSEEHRSFLACYGRFQRAASGDILIRQGAPQDSLYVLLSGTLHIVSEKDGRQQLLATLKDGDCVGEINLFDPQSASASAMFRTQGHVWVMSRAELDSFLEADPVAGVAVLRALLWLSARRIRFMNEKLVSSEQRGSLHNYWNSSYL